MIIIFFMLNSKKHRFTQLVIIITSVFATKFKLLTCYEIKMSAGMILTEDVVIDRMDLQSCHYTSFK